MKYVLLTLSALMLMFIDGTLTYDIFDPKNWSLADGLILIIALALLVTIAWGEQTKINKQNHIPR